MAATPAREPVRVGVGPSGVPPIVGPGDGVTAMDFFRRMEAHGYHSVSVGDHLDDRGSPIALLAAASQVTATLTLACHVLCNEFRNRAVLEQDVRTLGALAPGRLEIGLGVGWRAADFELAGLPMAPFDERISRLADTVALLRTLDGALRPTIVVGGGGRKMLTAAARLAEVVTINVPLGRPTEIGRIGVAQGVRSAFEQRMGWIRDAAAAAGRDVRLHAYIHHVCVGDGWRQEADRIAAANGLSPEEFLASPHVLAGEPAAVADQIAQRAEAYGLRYLSIPGSAAEVFAEVLPLLP